MSSSHLRPGMVAPLSHGDASAHAPYFPSVPQGTKIRPLSWGGDPETARPEWFNDLCVKALMAVSDLKREVERKGGGPLLVSFNKVAPTGTTFSFVYPPHSISYMRMACDAGFLADMFSSFALFRSHPEPMSFSIKAVGLYPYETREALPIPGVVVHIESHGMTEDFWTDNADALFHSVQPALMEKGVGAVLVGDKKLDISLREFTPA